MKIMPQPLSNLPRSIFYIFLFWGVCLSARADYLIITCASNKTVNAGVSWTFDSPSVSSLCHGDLTNYTLTVVSTTSNSIGCAVVNTRTWHVTNPCAASNQCSQTVTVYNPPSLSVTCAANKSVDCSASWTFDPPSVTSVCQCGTNYTISVLNTVTNGTCPQVVITRSWLVMNPCGQANTNCSQAVTVVKNNPQVFQGATNQSVISCSSTQVFFNVTASETCCGASSVVCSPPSGSAFPPGTSQVQCSATDCCGRVFTNSFFVVVVSNTNGLAFDRTTVRNLSYTACSSGPIYFGAPIANSGCCSNVSVVCTPASGVLLGPGMSTNIQCMATDCLGHSTSTNFLISVVAPTLQLTCQNKIVNCYDTNWGFDAPSIQLGCCPNTNITLVGLTPATNVGCPTLVSKTWLVSDFCGHSNSCSQLVMLAMPPPVITCPANLTAFATNTNQVSVTFSVPATAFCGSPVTVVCDPPSGSLFSLGSNSVSCYAVDGCSNQSLWCSFNLMVVPPPVTICPPSNAVTFSAGSALSLYVPRQGASDVPPVLDGVLSDGEYAGAWRFSHILYDPTLSLPPARANFLSTSNNLFVCITGLPAGSGPSTAFASLALDTTQAGGQAAGSNHVLFTLFENGNSQVTRGNGSGCFVPALDIQGWGAVRTQQGGQWTAEFQIPLSALGGGAPGSAVGFHLSHSDMRFVGDRAGWPFDASQAVPDTWGKLIWIKPKTPVTIVELDQTRITQGLEVDATAGQPYLKIAGKDTLVRVQLYTLGPVYQVASFAVQVIPPGRNFASIIPGDAAGQAGLNSMPFGSFVGSGVFQAWIDGATLSTPGEYGFKAMVTLSGSSSPQLIDLGTAIFYPTPDLHVLINPTANPAEPILNGYDPSLAQWDAAHLGNILPVLQEVNRIYPNRNGVARGLSYSVPFPAAGLVYVLMGASTCPLTDSNPTNLFGECDSYARKQADDLLNRWNGLAGPSSQLSRAVVLSAARVCLGGQEQSNWNPPTAGCGFDTSPTSFNTMVFCQELAHSYGEVKSYSPNSDPNNQIHSIHKKIPLYHNLGGVNLLTHQDIPSPQSVMFPFGDSTDQGYNNFFEGFEWNDLAPIELSIAPAPGPQFYFVGSIDGSDNVTPDYSQIVTDQALPLTPANTNGPYRLIFLNSQNPPAQLGQLPFDVNFGAALHGDDAPPSVLGLLLAAPLPAGTARVEIRKMDTLLYGVNASAAAPAVANVVATVSSATQVDLTWDASDADSPQLTHNVFYQADSSSARILVAHGLTSRTFSFHTDLVPSTTGGTLIVETSDGFNTGQAASQTFAIPDKPPVAAITSPQTNTVLVANVPFSLRGAAFDVTTGVLTGNQLAWTDTTTGAALGNGDFLQTALAAGTHTLSLQATAPSGLATTVFATVNVLADSDGDGLPDNYENQHPCLSASAPETDNDPDSDGLSTWFEMQIGTDPCNIDTDNDGISDFDELRLGSNPLDPVSKPAPNLLYPAVDQIDLGPCSNGLRTITVRTAPTSPSVTWSARASVPWLNLTGGGQGNGVINLTVDCTGLAPGTHTAQIVLSAAGGQTRVVQVQTEVPTPIQFTSFLQSNSPGSATISGTGVAATQYTIQTSTDLQAWSDAGTVTTDAQGGFSFTVDTTAFPRLFYRMRGQ